MEQRPIASTWARRTAISPTFTGWRKSMSSRATRRQWPGAPRAAAMFPTVAIHCIMRPPWICPGAPACSGNTHWTISVTVSLIDSLGRRRTGVSSSFIYHAARSKSSRAASALWHSGRRRWRRRLRGLDPGPVESVIAAGMKPEVPDFGSHHRPVQADVERYPGNLLGEEGLGPTVDAQTLGPERDLACPDEEIAELGVAVEGEVGGGGAAHRALARREWIEEQVRVAPLRLRLREGEVLSAILHGVKRGVARQGANVHRHGGRAERRADRLGRQCHLRSHARVDDERRAHP